jgi:hypothetical protein
MSDQHAGAVADGLPAESRGDRQPSTGSSDTRTPFSRLAIAERLGETVGGCKGPSN